MFDCAFFRFTFEQFWICSVFRSFSYFFLFFEQEKIKKKHGTLRKTQLKFEKQIVTRHIGAVFLWSYELFFSQFIGERETACVRSQCNFLFRIHYVCSNCYLTCIFIHVDLNICISFRSISIHAAKYLLPYFILSTPKYENGYSFVLKTLLV